METFFFRIQLSGEVPVLIITIKKFVSEKMLRKKLHRIVKDKLWESEKEFCSKKVTYVQSQTKSIGTEAILQLKKHFLTAYILVNKFFQKFMFDLTPELNSEFDKCQKEFLKTFCKLDFLLNI